MDLIRIIIAKLSIARTLCKNLRKRSRIASESVNLKAAGVLSQDQHLFEEPRNVNAAGERPESIPHTQIDRLAQASAIGNPSSHPVGRE